MNTATLLDSHILIKPSKALCASIKKLNPDLKMPIRIKNIFQNSSIKEDCSESRQPITLSSSDYDRLKSLDDKFHTKASSVDPLDKNIETYSSDSKNKQFLKIDDLLWLCKNLNGQNVYLHDLLKNSTVYVPENKQIERNPVLEKRCEKLKNEQENKKYQSMTKNVDNVRVRHPEDTIQYQMKALNRQLIAVFQFIVSVATGFAFGFIGIELMTGPLDFGFKLLLGIMCSLIIALAELYFLAKQLNEL